MLRVPTSSAYRSQYPATAGVCPGGTSLPGVPRQLNRSEVLALLKPVLESDAIGKVGQT